MRLIGRPSGDVEFAPPSLMAQLHAKGFAESGSLEDWRSRVAEKASLSTSFTVGIAAAFAAPLLSATGLQNFGLHLFGPSRAGKTTTLLGSMSVYGYGREEDLPNWNTSGPRLLGSAGAFGDIVFPLNEVGAARGKRKQTYEGLRDLYAQFAEGRDRDRHSSWRPGKVARRSGFAASASRRRSIRFRNMPRWPARPVIGGSCFAPSTSARSERVRRQFWIWPLKRSTSEHVCKSCGPL